MKNLVNRLKYFIIEALELTGIYRKAPGPWLNLTYGVQISVDFQFIVAAKEE